MTTIQTKAPSTSRAVKPIPTNVPTSAPTSAATRAATRAKTVGSKPKLKSGALSFNTCVKSISNVTISRRGLLQLELAVGLAVFMDSGVTNKASKNLLNEVYHRAGYDCMDSSGKEYKNVNRRIQASAGLFGKIGLEVINHWADQAKESKLLQAIAQGLGEFKFESLDDVHDYVGRKSNRTVKAAGEAAGAAADISSANPFHIMVGKSVVDIPKTLTEAELIELASKILALADEVHAQAAQAAQEAAGGAGGVKVTSGEGEVAGDRVMH